MENGLSESQEWHLKDMIEKYTYSKEQGYPFYRTLEQYFMETDGPDLDDLEYAQVIYEFARMNNEGILDTYVNANTRKLTIEVEMRARWVPYFVDMLTIMEYLGNVGSSRAITFYSDGDGDFRPKFKIDGKPVDTKNIKTEEILKDHKINYLIDAG